MNYIYYACWKLTVFHKNNLQLYQILGLKTPPVQMYMYMMTQHWSSSETQGQSVRLGERARRKFSSMGERAPGYRLSPNYFQKFKRMPAPDWAQKMLCIIVPNRRTVSPEFFLGVCTWRLLPGSFTKLVRARETFIFYFPNWKRRDYRWVEKTFGMLSAGAIQFAPRKFCLWRITMYRK